MKRITDSQETFIHRLYSQCGSYAFPFQSLYGHDINHLSNCEREWASQIISEMLAFTKMSGTVSEKLSQLEASKGIETFVRLFAGVSDKVFERRISKVK